MRLRKTLIGMGLFTAIVALTFLSGKPVLAASTKDVIVANTPAEPVPVTGEVEVLNDSLYQPYIKTGAFFLANGVSLAELPFDVPDGKRLILETVAVQANVQPGQKVRISLDSQVAPAINKYVIGVLPVQLGAIIGSEYYIANQPFKLRQDWFSGSHDEILVRMLRDSSAGDASLLVTIYGYLVDSPSQGLGF